MRDENEALAPENRKEIKIINNKVLVNDVLDEPEVKPPQPEELFPNPEKQDNIDKMSAQMVETDKVEKRNSIFTGLAVKVSSIEEVNNAYIAAAQRYPSADHIVAAYGFKDWNSGQIKFGHADDKEYGAGVGVRKIMAELKAKDTAVFVVRRFGGVHLGTERFHTIQAVARKAIQLLSE